MRRLLIAAVATFALAQPAIAACTAANSLVKVTNYKLGAYEYVDFWIKPAFTGTIAYTAPTSGTFTEDPSGNSITVAGNRWTDVKFTNMFWTCSTLTVFNVPKPRIKAVKRIAQFEGTIEYVIGRQNGLAPTYSNMMVGSLRRIRFRYN